MRHKPRETTPWQTTALAAVVAALFFTMGEFELLDLLHVKRPVQATLLGMLTILAIMVPFRRPFREVLVQPLFLLTGLFLTMEFLVHGKLIRGIEAAVTLLLLVVVFCAGRDFVRLTLRMLIMMAGLFASLAILQFVIFMFLPGLAAGTVSSQMNPTGGSEWTVLSPMAYMGMTTGEYRNVAGFALPRMTSFLREPSLIPPFFLIPAALALTFRDRTRMWVVPIFAFAFVAFSGSVYAPIVFGAGFWLVMRMPVFRRSPTLLAMLGFVSIIALLLLIYATTRVDEALVSFFTTFVEGKESNIGFLDKIGSVQIRMAAAREFIASGFEGGLDTPNIAIAAIGLILYSYVRAGMLGAILMSANLYVVFRAIARYRILGGGSITAAALLFGTFVQVGFLNTYGYYGAPGFLSMALVIARMRDLTPVVVRQRHSLRRRTRPLTASTTPA
jgi:hypothetical protein